MATVTHSGAAKITLPADEELLITREFDAPRHLVYKAWTTPELVMRWWAGKRGKMTVADIDLRVGGTWRYVMTAGSHGGEVAFNGEFQEIVPEEKLVHTEVYEGAPGAPGLNIVTFTDLGDGRTRVDLLGRYESKEVRDMIIDSGMEVGMQEQYDALEELVKTL
jgi:uncharacterized protein YndB with AHSA1/START domain